MPRVLGIDIPGNKRVAFSLRYIYGIGPKRADEIVAKAGIDPAVAAKDLTDEQITHIAGILQTDYRVE
ncbi:MAG: 30S ribosomal protein S13, partial [Kiritimatiellia bacterium]|nr:30S ribosomal protein S13 [Kiritimatiellia bacterium]